MCPAAFLAFALSLDHVGYPEKWGPELGTMFSAIFDWGGVRTVPLSGVSGTPTFGISCETESEIPVDSPKNGVPSWGPCFPIEFLIESKTPVES